MRPFPSRSPSTSHSGFAATTHASAQGALGAFLAELPESAERDVVVPAILRGALRLLHAEVAALSLYDSRSERHHAIAVASTDGHWSSSRSLAAKVPPDFPGTAPQRTDDPLVLPDDEPAHPFAALLATVSSTALYVALAYEDAIVGTLHVVRPAALPFAAEERRLARAAADHAILALATVRVV
jgi:hypothetical protein